MDKILTSAAPSNASTLYKATLDDLAGLLNLTIQKAA